MLTKTLVAIIVGWLLLCCGFDSGPAPTVAPALASQTDGTQSTNVMQQMDHRRRLSKQELDQARAKVAAQASGVGEADVSSAGIDYAVVGILGVTGVVLYAVCRRRNCWPRRRARKPVRPRA